MRKPKYRRPGECYDKSEVNLILSCITKKASTQQRARAAIVTMYGAGLSISEIINLMPNDINMETGEIIVRCDKKRKSRKVGLPHELLPHLQIWIDRRKKFGFNNEQCLFCTLKGTPCHSSYWRNLCHRISKRIEVKTGHKIRVHPHGFRHAMVKSMIYEGFNIIDIQKQLGYSSLATTLRYIENIMPDALSALRFQKDINIKETVNNSKNNEDKLSDEEKQEIKRKLLCMEI